MTDFRLIEEGRVIGGGGNNVPTAFSSMRDWAFTFAADMAAELAALERKSLRRKAMMGNSDGCRRSVWCREACLWWGIRSS